MRRSSILASILAVLFSAAIMTGGQAWAASATGEQTAPVLMAGDALRYEARIDGDHQIRAVDVEAVHPAFLRRRVAYPGPEAPGTIIVETARRQLYFVEPGGTALRYGIAVGAEGFGWTGRGTIERNARWPSWTPPATMIARKPALAKWAGGMPGGAANPLGARALYIYFGGRDSMFRIHGTNEPLSIGTSASSGCFRMLNQDVIDLYARVAKGAKVIVR